MLQSADIQSLKDIIRYCKNEIN